MHSNGDSWASLMRDAAVLAEIVAEVEKSQELIAAAQAAQTRALARAGDLARVQSGRSRSEACGIMTWRCAASRPKWRG